jgi:TIR domain
MAYEYDVFISYKRGGTRDEWMRDLFMPIFREKLDEAFANHGLEDPRIFFDQVEIKDGANWEIAIRSAVARSKFMVSICTPTYFRRSEWCMREFAAMYQRAIHLGLLAIGNNRGLIRPLMKQRIDSLPEFIRVIQVLDYSRFNQVGPAFRNTQEYLDFQIRLQADTENIAHFISQYTPEYDPQFESLEWMENSYQMLLADLDLERPKQRKIGWA